MVAFKKLLVIAALAATATLSTASPAPTQVGVDQPHNLVVKPGQSRQEVISYPHASYVAVHFAEFNLPTGDVVVVRSPDGSVKNEYTGLGRANNGKSKDGFYASFVPGNTAIVEYRSSGVEATGSDFGFKIDKFAGGFASQQESLCGPDQTLRAKCFQDQKPAKYGKAQAVARLPINGNGFCTGWLVGSEGHLLTNQHCITEADTAKNTIFEFEAESGSCNDKCASQLGCKGTVVANSAEFIQNSAEHDWALVKLPASVAQKYGYLQLRASGPVLNEEIYIPQHPQGWAKRIADVVDGGKPGTITNLAANSSCSAEQVGYMLDTQGGSSGSPVLAASDNAVVALHHCGCCENTAVNILKVIADFQKGNIAIKGLLSTGDAPTSMPTAAPTSAPTDAPTSAPTDASTRPQPAPRPVLRSRIAPRSRMRTRATASGNASGMMKLPCASIIRLRICGANRASMKV